MTHGGSGYYRLLLLFFPLPPPPPSPMGNIAVSEEAIQKTGSVRRVSQYSRLYLRLSILFVWEKAFSFIFFENCTQACALFALFAFFLWLYFEGFFFLLGYPPFLLFFYLPPFGSLTCLFLLPPSLFSSSPPSVFFFPLLSAQ